MATDADLARLAGPLLGSPERLVEPVVAAARGRIAALDQEASALLEASVTENLVAAVTFVLGRIRADELEAPAAALAYARTLAQRDVPLSALVRAYRLGQAQVLEAVFERIDEVAVEDRAPVVMLLVRRAQEYIDRIVEQVGRAYEVERERWVASQGGVRQQWVNDLLRGAAVDVAEASAVLGYPVADAHVCVRLWPAEPLTAGEASTTIAEAHQHLARTLRARESLLVPTDEREVRIWLATDSARVVPARRGSRLHAAVSRPCTGLAGFRRSAAQADLVHGVLAHGVLAHRPGPARWLRYAEVAPVALLARDLPALRDLVGSTLGDLAAPSERAAMLRSTLRVFLAHHRSYAGTGTALSLHRNSVQYRVQQAQALLPRPEPDELHVRLALEAAELLGPAVLLPGS